MSWRAKVILSIPRLCAPIQRVVAAVMLASTVALIPSLAHAQGVKASRPNQPLVVSRSSSIIEQQGLRFKDLNRNGVLDAYEDWRLPPAARAKDLVSRMTLEDKAGMMMHGTARSSGPTGGIGFATRHSTHHQQ